MGREWKVGDWAESPAGNRHLVYKTSGEEVYGIQLDHFSMSWLASDETMRHLPDCTGWDWVEPKSKEVEPAAHEWKLGDWAKTPQNNIVRFVFIDDEGDHMFVDRNGDVSAFNELMLVHLPGCSNWHYDPEEVSEEQKPQESIQPPPGYRLVTDGLVIEGDLFRGSDGGWYECVSIGSSIPIALAACGHRNAYARKIEPKPVVPPEGYRLMNADETIRHGDMFFQSGAWNNTGIGVSEIPVEIALKKYAQYRIEAYARRLEADAFKIVEPKYRPFANAAEFEPYIDKWIFDPDAGIRGIRSWVWRAVGYSDEGIYRGTVLTDYADAFRDFKFTDGTPFGVLETEPDHAAPA